MIILHSPFRLYGFCLQTVEEQMGIFALPVLLCRTRNHGMTPALHRSYLLHISFYSLKKQNERVRCKLPSSLGKRPRLSNVPKPPTPICAISKPVCNFPFSSPNHVARFFVFVIIQYSIWFVIIQTGIFVQKCKLFSIFAREK